MGDDDTIADLTGRGLPDDMTDLIGLWNVLWRSSVVATDDTKTDLAVVTLLAPLGPRRRFGANVG